LSNLQVKIRESCDAATKDAIVLLAVRNEFVRPALERHLQRETH